MNTLRRIFFFSLLITLTGSFVAAEEELELVLQAGHTRAVSDAVFLDETHLVTSSEDGSLKLWNAAERRVKRTLWPPLDSDGRLGGGQSVNDLVLTEAGLWALYYNGVLRLWDPVEGRLLKTLQLPEDSVTFETRATSDGRGTLYLYGSGPNLHKIENGSVETLTAPDFDSFSVSRDGSVIAGVTNKGVVYGTLENLDTIPESFANRWGVSDLALSEDGKTLVLATSVNWVEGWDLQKKTLLFRAQANSNAIDEESLKGPGISGENLGLTLTRYSGDSYLIASEGGKVSLVDGSGKVTQLFNFEEYGLNRLAVTPSRNMIAGGFEAHGRPAVPVAKKENGTWQRFTMGGRGLNFTDIAARDNTLFLSAGSNRVLSFDLNTGQPSHAYETGYFPIICLGRETLFAGGNDGHLHCFENESGKQLWQRDFIRSGAQFGRGIMALALSPDGRELAVSVLEIRPQFFLVDARTGEITREIPVKKVVRSVTYSKDGKRLYMTDYDGVGLYDLSYNKTVYSWEKQLDRTDDFVTLLNHPTRESLLGLSRKGYLVEFNPANLDEAPISIKLDLNQAVSMKAAGSNLIVAADLGALLIDTKGKTLKSYGNHLTTASDVLALDNAVITTGWDSQVLFWDKDSARQLATLLSLDDGKNWLFISSDFHFDGTPEAQALIEWRWNGELYELERFFEKFYQPGLLARTLKPGESSRETVKPAVLGQAPPKLKIVEPREVEQGLFQVDIEPESPLPEGAEIRVYHNGHRVPGEPPYKIRAVEGENSLRASAFNQSRTVESEPARLTFVSKTPTPERTLHVFAAAVNEYPNKLDFAVQDAQSFVGAFEPGLYDKVNKVTLYDQKADKAGIIKALSAISCQPQDTLLVFLAGHGTIIDKKFHFIPFGADGEESATSLSSAELGKILAGLPATRQVLFLDTCHAGASAKDLAELLIEKETPLIASEEGSALIKDQQVLARQAGTFLVAGSTPDATAAEVPELGHGLFTYAVLNGLQGGLGKDQEVTVNELLRYLSQQVPELSLKFRGSRHGIWQFSAGQDFPIAKPR